MKTAGMKEKERKKTLKREISIPIWTVILCAGLIGGVFAEKNLHGEWKILVFLILEYFLVQYLFLESMRIWIVRRMED